MWRNYLNIALRRLRRQKGYALINISGLAVGLAACILITLYIQDELSYDRFHENAERIYQVIEESVFDGDMRRHGTVPVPLARTAQREIPGVEEAVQISTIPAPVLRGNQRFEGETILSADSTFFDVFTFPLLRGKPSQIVGRPNTAAITRVAATRYFGSDDPIGETLTLDTGSYLREVTVEVTGILENVPRNSHLQFDIVTSNRTLFGPSASSSSWGSKRHHTFLVLQENADAGDIAETITTIRRDRAAPGVVADKYTYSLQPLTEIYLSEIHQAAGFRGEKRYLYIFGTIGLFILLIACINYMNLATARSTERGREVGVRRTVGASRSQIAHQMLSESLLVTLMSFLFAIGIARLALPLFNEIAGTSLVLFTPSNGLVLLGLLAGALLVGLISGSYPAIYLSRFRPSGVLRGGGDTAGGEPWIRKGLVVVQFAIAMTLIVGMTVIYWQVEYVQGKDLGFNEEHVVAVNLPSDYLREQYAVFKQSFSQLPGVASVAAASTVPSEFGMQAGYPVTIGGEERTFTAYTARVDHDFIETLGLKLLAGRSFSKDHASDVGRACILNEAAVKELGWESPVGKQLRSWTVIGVVEDFHYHSLREPIQPVMFRMSSGGPSDAEMGPYRQLVVRLSGGDVSSVLAALQSTWRSIAPEQPFQYSFLDQEFAQMYRSEQRLSQLISGFAGIALFIACLGLVGLSAYTAERRTKEIGIRKVLGATTASIVTLLSKDFVKLVALAILLATPLAYVIMERWLQDFAYRIEIGPAVFLPAGGFALAATFLTISYQSLKAALTNPADSLRYE